MPWAEALRLRGGEKIAERVHDGLTLPNPKVRYHIAPDTMRHLLNAVLPKRTMDKIIAKRLGLLPRDAHALLRHDAQAGLFDDRVHRPGQVTLGRIGFDDRESPLDRHRSVPIVLEDQEKVGGL